MNDSIKKEILDWSQKFPLDRWWRQKHGVAFGSSIHREISFIDQLFEYSEDQLFDRYMESRKYIPNSGDWLKQQEQRPLGNIQEEAEKAFKDLPEDFNIG